MNKINLCDDTSQALSHPKISPCSLGLYCHFLNMCPMRRQFLNAQVCKEDHLPLSLCPYIQSAYSIQPACPGHSDTFILKRHLTPTHRGGGFEKFSPISLAQHPATKPFFSEAKPVSVFGLLHVRQQSLVW